MMNIVDTTAYPHCLVHVPELRWINMYNQASGDNIQPAKQQSKRMTVLTMKTFNDIGELLSYELGCGSFGYNPCSLKKNAFQWVWPSVSAMQGN
jgi:hypothetical protein